MVAQHGGNEQRSRTERRPPLKERQVEVMLACFLRDQTMFETARQQLRPESFSQKHRVYAALWATVLEYHTHHKRLPGAEALAAEWEARLAVVSAEEFGHIELQIIDEFLQALWNFDPDSVDPTIAFRYLKLYLEDQLSRQFAKDFDPTQFTPSGISELLTTYQARAAAIAAIEGDDAKRRPISVAALLAEELPDQQYAVDNLLAMPGPAGESGNRIAFLAGPIKSLKTRIAVDLAVALASGTPFLESDRFLVQQRVPVLLISAESGRRIIRQQLQEVCAAPLPSGVRRRRNPAKMPLHLYFDAPTLTDPASESWLRRQIIATGARIVIIEPLYFCLLGAGSDTKVAADLHAMGAIFRRLSAMGDELGILFVLGHHAGKTATSSRGHAPMELLDLHGAGVAEAASQWLMVNRRRAYAETNQQRLHELWLRYGGRQGHAGLIAADITEGPRDQPEWRTRIMSPSELKQEITATREEQEAAEAHELEQTIIDAIAASRNGTVSESGFRRAGVRGTQRSIQAALNALQTRGQIVLEMASYRGQPVTRFRLAHPVEMAEASRQNMNGHQNSRNGRAGV